MKVLTERALMFSVTRALVSRREESNRESRMG